MANIAFLGTGLLGGALAQAAAKRGDTVTAWNRSSDKVAALAPFGVKAAATAADAVRGAARIHIVLKDDAVVDAVIAAALPGLAADAIVLDQPCTEEDRAVTAELIVLGTVPVPDLKNPPIDQVRERCDRPLNVDRILDVQDRRSVPGKSVPAARPRTAVLSAPCL